MRLYAMRRGKNHAAEPGDRPVCIGFGAAVANRKALGHKARRAGRKVVAMDAGVAQG